MVAVRFNLSENKRCGLSLTEVLVAMAIAMLGIFAAVAGFLNAATQAEASAYVLAGQCQALERLEQVRAAKWDPNADPPVDQMVSTNFPVLVKILDIPRKDLKIYATNYTTITLVSANPPLKMMRVDCVWSWMNKKLQTNSVMTYRGPDQ